MIYYLLLTIIGLVVGSFLTMLSYRLPRGLSLLGRSICPGCQKQIKWYQNIPVVYFLLSRGKCGSCKNSISSRYPIIEISTALFFVFTFYLWTDGTYGVYGSLGTNGIISQWNSLWGIVAFPLFLLLTILFLLLTIIDLEHQILPDKILLLLTLLMLLFLLFSPSPTLFVNIFTGFLSFVFFLAIYLVTQKRGMGFGDVKMSFVLGSLLGFPNVLVWLFLSFLSGALIGLILIATKKASFGKPIPFGPYLLISAWATFFAGDIILKWYLGYY